MPPVTFSSNMGWSTKYDYSSLVTMEKNDENAKIRIVRNSRITPYTCPSKDIIGISLTQNFPISPIFAIETLIE